MKTYQSIGKEISIINKYSRIYINRTLEAVGVRSGTFRPLMMLYHNEGITQEQMAKHFHVDKATAARAVKKLMDDGFVERRRSEEDRRAYRLFLTDKANEIKPEVFKALDDWGGVLTQGLSEEETETLFKLLETVRENARNEIKG